MKKLFVLFVFLIVPLFIAFAIAAPSLPHYYDTHIDDFASLFTPQQTQQLHDLLTGVQQDTTAEIVVVTINTTAPYAPAEYRTMLFNAWQIGKKGKDNGLLILYAVQEKRIEVETGYGIEGILPDSKVGRILDEFYVPARDSGNTTQGIIAATQALANVIEENKADVSSGQAAGNSESNSLNAQGNSAWIIIVLAIVWAAAIYGIYRARKNAKNPENKEMPLTSKTETTDSNNKYRIIIPVILIFALIASVISQITWLIILFFILVFISPFFIPRKCSKDGEKLTFLKSTPFCTYYRCSKGHVLKVNKTHYYGFAGAGLGGLGGGGFGGGGFGGGGSGGGGAGR